MKQFTLIAILATCLSISAHAQNKTYLGVEFSVANDLYETTDDGGYLNTAPLRNGLGGITIRQGISRKLFIESGLIMKYYHERYGFKPVPNSTSSDDPSWLIPIRFGFNWNLYKEKIYLVPVVGYTFGISPSPGYILNWGTETSGSTSIDYTFAANTHIAHYFSLLQTGVGFEFKVFNALLFSISTNYFFGFDNIHMGGIIYTVNNSNTYTGTSKSKGEFWCVSTGIRYPISNIWQ